MKKKTVFFNDVEHKWYLIDAKDKVLGRVCSRIARILQGKHKAKYSPNSLCGDKVVVINAKYVKITGNSKPLQKIYTRYSGYHSGKKDIPYKDMQAKRPTFIIYHAVKGMLPKNRLAKEMLSFLKIHPEDKYRQEAQKPELIEV